MDGFNRALCAAALVCSLAIGCSNPIADYPSVAQPAGMNVPVAGQERHFLVDVDPANRRLTMVTSPWQTKAVGVWVRSENASWNAPVFAFDLFVTNMSGSNMPNVQGVVLSTTPASPTVMVSHASGTTGDGLPFYSYGDVPDGATASARWQFTIPAATPFRFVFTVRQGTGVDAHPQKNHAPVAFAITPATSIVAPGSTVPLQATCTDSDGDPLTYSWSAAGGGSISGTGASVVYTAPNADGLYPVGLTVSDERGATATGAASVAVASAQFGLTQGALSFGNVPAPEVKTVQVSPANIIAHVGDRLTITATGFDAAGNPVPTRWYWKNDPVSYQWYWDTSLGAWTYWSGYGAFDGATTGSHAIWQTGRYSTLGNLTLSARSDNNHVGTMVISFN
jgi:hypothetical protein